MPIIPLTNIKGEKIYIAVQHILMIIYHEINDNDGKLNKFTRVSFVNDSFVDVNESPEEIIHAIMENT